MAFRRSITRTRPPELLSVYRQDEELAGQNGNGSQYRGARITFYRLAGSDRLNCNYHSSTDIGADYPQVLVG